MAEATLALRICTTDDPEGFKRQYRNAFSNGYGDYTQLARKCQLPHA